jgi:hypothetical protein
MAYRVVCFNRLVGHRLLSQLGFIRNQRCSGSTIWQSQGQIISAAQPLTFARHIQPQFM